ncbi:MAG: hypothetical protein LUH20_02865 [Lachnospiraceae bacterium]|nr:hypothetical protein [Lachnospiraceae bacterium]
MDGWKRPEQEQMAGFAEAFYGLAGLFQKMPRQRERLGEAELRVLFENVRESLCEMPERKNVLGGRVFFELQGFI